jgi:hypothetical protein
MDEFTKLVEDLNNNIISNKEIFSKTVIKNPSLAYYKLNELSKFVGSRYNLLLEIHFPDKKKIYDVNDYGTENISIIIDKFRKSFPLPRSQIKEEANRQFGTDIVAADAYMYEGKEGVRIKFTNNFDKESRIEILPGSFHLWTKIDDKIKQFCNWLMLNVYSERVTK